MGFFKDIVKPFKELGQEALKISTTIGSAGMVRYDEDKGFKEGFVTKTAIKETGKLIGNTIDLATKNPALTDVAGMYFGIPNASEFLNRKEVEKPVSPVGPIVVEQLQPTKNNNMIVYIGGVIAAIVIFFLLRKK